MEMPQTTPHIVGAARALEGSVALPSGAASHFMETLSRPRRWNSPASGASPATASKSPSTVVDRASPRLGALVMLCSRLHRA